MERSGSAARQKRKSPRKKEENQEEKNVMTQRWSSVVGHLPAGTSSFMETSKAGKQKGNAAPSWGRGDDGIVKLTPATERHVHFPASMHDVPSRGEAEGLR